MRNAIALFVVVQSVCMAGLSQQPEQLLNQWAIKNPVEKIYIHFDRDDYFAGQTIWFKTYVYSDFLPAARSTNLFVELSNASSVLISRQVLPLFAGFANGQFELADTLPAGTYQLRAYTTNMLNHAPEFLYKRTLSVIGKKVVKTSPVSQSTLPVIEFFPEGGNFVSGLSNTIAFKATNEKGMPVEVSGSVKNDKGETVAEFSSYHDGMGFFDLSPVAGNNYYAVVANDPEQKKYHLPQQVSKGIVFRVISSGVTKSYEILQYNDDPIFKASYMIAQMQHHVVFKRTFRESDKELSGIIPTGQLSSGILHITVFNRDGMPLAERLTFVDNKEYIQPGEISVDTLDFGERKKNHFTLTLKDTVQGSFSVSVTDPAFDLLPSRQHNIYSGLLLSSDLSGPIHNPAYYFSAKTDSVQNALDLVMMTNGWRRFRWTTLAQTAASEKKHADAGYINLSGKITLEATKKPFGDKDLLMFIVSAFGKNIQMLHTDANGQFLADSIVFYGNARILFTDIKGRKSKLIDVKLSGDSLHRRVHLPAITLSENQMETVMAEREKRVLEEYMAFLKAEGLTLEGVTVKGRKKSSLELLEEKYVSGPFAGMANSTLDLTEENTMGFRDIFDYLKMRVPGLQVITDPLEPGYVIRYRQTASISSMGELPMTIFLNEVPSDADAVSSIPPQEIALVKVFGTFVGATGNGAGGVLAIYTKKDAELRSAREKDLSEYRGYSIVKEFYSPNYSVEQSSKADHRVTLLWSPAILVDGVNLKIPISFFNNDRTKQFKIVVEGVTAEGKLVMIEKTIGDKKAF